MQHEHGDDEQRRRRRPAGRRCAADRVAHRLDADPRVAPVVDRVERPVEGGEEPHVEQLHEQQQAEHRPDDPGHDAPRAGGQDQRQRDERRRPRAAAATNRSSVSRSAGRGRPARPRRSAAASTVSTAATPCDGPRRRRLWLVVARRPPRPVGRRPRGAPQPPDVAAERLGEQGQRDGEDDLLQRQGQRRRRRRPISVMPCTAASELAPVARAAAGRASTAAPSRPPGRRSARRRSRAPTSRRGGRRTR